MLQWDCAQLGSRDFAWWQVAREESPVQGESEAESEALVHV
jgi:hypothetical protein